MGSHCFLYPGWDHTQVWSRWVGHQMGKSLAGWWGSEGHGSWSDSTWMPVVSWISQVYPRICPVQWFYQWPGRAGEISCHQVCRGDQSNWEAGLPFRGTETGWNNGTGTLWNLTRPAPVKEEALAAKQARGCKARGQLCGKDLGVRVLMSCREAKCQGLFSLMKRRLVRVDW